MKRSVVAWAAPVALLSILVPRPTPGFSQAFEVNAAAASARAPGVGVSAIVPALGLTPLGLSPSAIGMVSDPGLALEFRSLGIASERLAVSAARLASDASARLGGGILLRTPAFGIRNAASDDAPEPAGDSVRRAAGEVSRIGVEAGVGVDAARRSGASLSTAHHGAESAFAALHDGERTQSGDVTAGASSPVPNDLALSRRAPGAEGQIRFGTVPSPLFHRPMPSVPEGYDREALSHWGKRTGLRLIEGIWGVRYSAPAVGPALTEMALRDVAAKRAIFLDLHDTLVDKDDDISAEMIERIAAARRAGKVVALITDGITDKSLNPELRTIFESLAAVPGAAWQGVYVAADGGGRIYRYQPTGELKLLHAAKTLERAELDRLDLAIRAARLRTIRRIGDIFGDRPTAKTQFKLPYTFIQEFELPPTAGNKGVAWLWAAAGIFKQELRRAGFPYELQLRIPRNPAHRPYLILSMIDKSYAVSWIAEAETLAARDAAGVGDNPYYPKHGRAPGWVHRLAERLSGRAIPETANDTDRFMEVGLPGMLMLAVGRYAPPRANVILFPEKGPAMTGRILEAFASRPYKAPEPPAVTGRDIVRGAGAAVVIAATLLLISFLYFSFFTSSGLHPGAAVEYGPSLEQLFGPHR